MTNKDINYIKDTLESLYNVALDRCETVSQISELREVYSDLYIKSCAILTKEELKNGVLPKK